MISKTNWHFGKTTSNSVYSLTWDVTRIAP